MARAPRPPALELRREIEGRLLTGRCAYCGAGALPDLPLTREHAIPRSRGAGRREWRVIVPACRQCNGRRGAQPLAAFLLARPKRLSRLLDYLDSLPVDAVRQVDLRVFAEVLAAILLTREFAPPDQSEPSAAVPERAIQRRRRTTRRVLERLQEQAARGAAPSGRQGAHVSVSGKALCRLAGVLAVAWGAWEGFIAGELSALHRPQRRAARKAGESKPGPRVAA